MHRAGQSVCLPDNLCGSHDDGSVMCINKHVLRYFQFLATDQDSNQLKNYQEQQR